MKTRNGTEAPEGRPSGTPGASSKAAARRGRQGGEPANRPDKPASPGKPKGASPSAVPTAAQRGHQGSEPAKRSGKPKSPGRPKGASPSAVPTAAQRGHQGSEPAKRSGKPKSPGRPKGASPSAAPDATAPMRRDGTPGRKVRGRGANAQSGSVNALAPPGGAPRCREKAGRASPGARDPEAALRRILGEDCFAESKPKAKAKGRPARSAQRSGHSGGSESGATGSGGGGGLSRTGRRRRGTPALGRSLADLPADGGKVLNPGLEILLGRAPRRAPQRRPGRAESPGGDGGKVPGRGVEILLGRMPGRAPQRRPGRAEGPGGDGGGAPPATASENWSEPLPGVPDPRQVREALDVFVKLKLHRSVQDVAEACGDAGALGVGHMLWSLARRGILADEAAAFATLREAFGAESDIDADSSGDPLPCNRRTAIHALRHAGLLDPALSVRVVKPRHVMPGFRDALAAVAIRFAVPEQAILGKSRRRRTVAARFAVMAIQREVADVSYVRIGRDMDGRHHSTAMHAVASVARRRREDPELDRTLAACADSADNAVIERHLGMLGRVHQPARGR